MKKISLIAASLLLAGNVAANDSLESAIKAGTFSGDVTLYGERVNKSGNNADSGFTMGSINIAYETGDFHGFKASVGARANHDFSEKNDGEDYNDDSAGKEPKSLLHTFNLSYANDFGSLTVGRQEIDLEWMTDFHEAAVLAITAVPNTTIVIGHSERKAAADADAALEKFEDIGEHGAQVVDVKFEGIDNLLLNPYYYNANDIASWVGMKADFNTDMFGATANYAKSSEDTQADADIIAVEGRLNVAGFGFGVGYVATDDTVGAGSMTTLGDTPNNPFDRIAGGDGEKVYDVDARTTYASVNYEVAGVGLTAVYGETKYGAADDKHKELDLVAEYGINDNLTVAALYVGADAQDSDNDYDKFTLTLEYTF